MADMVSETRVISPEVCPCCGESLHNVKGYKTDTHYVVEMPPITVTAAKYINEEKTCRTCGKKISGEFPYEAAALQQYGPNLKAFVVLLAQTGMVVMNRDTEILEAVTGIKIRSGTVAHTIKKCGKNLEERVKSIKEEIKGANVVHFDETGMMSQGKLKWLHTAWT
jgi:transposase